ncbi:MAG: 1-deoxy-D-xylulose-5-phosphate synthase, partial [Firmicutes bacterium]|nr:1-deoxy-D-xylulose-5-phosphate synthase [Bacillota bacterium]
MSIFESLNLPDDLENVKNLDDFAFELRHEIIKLVSKNGGHLASNLGVIEATISLLSVFKKKNDAIVWDVGHQCYAYKILTGRFDQINTIRKNGGLSGFSNSDESVYDKFKSGHSSNSISAALGLAEFKKKNGQTGKVVVFIGDGAMTGGLAFEGLNNSANFGNLVIILNDNSMSISKNVGAISRYFMKLRMRSGYLKTKRLAKNILKNLPLGSNIKRFIDELKFCIRTLIYKESTIFEKLGLKYYGPIDGHNIYDMIKVMSIARDLDIPVIIHIVTKKGKG